MSQPSKISVWQKIKQFLQKKSSENDEAKSAKADDATLAPETLPQKKPAADQNDALAKSQNTTNQDAESLKKSLENNTPADDELPFFDRQTESDATPITDFIKDYFEQKQWHYTYYAPRDSDSQQSHHLSLRMKNKDIDCGYLFRVQENNHFLAVYGILPFLIPESHQSAAMLLITQINYDMIIGNLEMDINDGEVRYKNAIDVEVLGLDEDILEGLLQSVVAMTTVAFEIFSDLINTPSPSNDLPTLLEELHAEAQSRTFFLPTEFVQ
ncbi:type III secretion system chaperone family protein [Psychrobacter ciconiae]|uniref:YbjN domain-containing protein n=1 Tax=Psychrobacter ciconiae TaxID=1553449 RepID=UPI0019191C2F|nr:YbjN domain-containing protein [Psychrobacter ciconiae]